MDENLIRLSLGIRLGDFDNPDNISHRFEILNTTRLVLNGEYELAFSKGQLKQMVKNFYDKNLGRDVPINLDHPGARMAESEAVGWVEDLEIKEKDEMANLYAQASWTKRGKELVASGAYKYSSIGAYTNYVSHRDGKTEMGMVLFEVSLTNEPGFRALPEINEQSVARFSELCHSNKKQSKNPGRHRMDDKDKLIMTLNEQLATNKKDFETLSVSTKSLERELEVLKKEILNERGQKEKALRESKLNIMITEQKITPAQKEAAMKLTENEYKGFLTAIELSDKKAYDTSPSKGISVDTTESGAKSVQDELVERVEKLRLNNTSLSFSDGVSRVLAADPELEKRFNQERE